jgi:hypothetical protein
MVVCSAICRRDSSRGNTVGVLRAIVLTLTLVELGQQRQRTQ